MAAHQVFTVYLSLSVAQWQAYYRGQVQHVRVQAEQGVWLQIPLSALRPFVHHGGLVGHYAIYCDLQNRLQQIQPLKPWVSSPKT